ncbi:AXL2 [Candida pseudojiufengensis]|uniref:AXL2 n=1 Tax=Candida pseudojiufengensis TaxID=497109 RepID=UPI0022255E47|nr:AXL2 [Candida pseudojiufengensis]KAI5959400.1 AXL2 [Candida pseudojiufengensis]
MGFPFNEQLPNVGRINEDYSFTIANTTYKSNSNGQITYQASNLPSWLTFDSNSRTFSGRPDESNVGEFQITLQGTDESDQSTMSNDYNMIVSNDTGLHLVDSNIMNQAITSFGKTNGNNGLVVKPGENINLKFNKDIFESYSSSNRPIIAYYGRSADRSSLPNWLSFNGDDLTFSGTVPQVTSENAPSFEYGFSFIASDYYGYAGASGNFKLIVGGHQLNTNLNDTIKINGTFEQDIDGIIPILSNVFLDGELITKDNISEVYGNNLPNYLSLDEDDYALIGNLPNSSETNNFTITVRDIYGNTVDIGYSFDTIGSIFTIDSLNDVNATKDEWFQYQILSSIFTNINKTDIKVSYDDANWLNYNNNNRTLNGLTPKNFDELKITIEGSMDSEDESRSFNIRGVNKEITSSSSSVSSSTTSSSSSTSSAASATATSTETSETSTSAATTSHSNSNRNRDLAIGLGVGIPVFLILLACLFLFCCCYKRRKNKQDSDSEKGTITSSTTTNNNDGTFTKGGILPIDPKHESQVNLMKLEDLSPNSSSSSLTHVESENTTFFDTQEQPMKSWRANTESDDIQPITTTNNNNRNSDASLSTVNTEQLFSVRLVEDQSIRNSGLTSSKYLSNQSLNALLRRENSSNIQRLDSEGNITDYNALSPLPNQQQSQMSSPERQRISQSPSQLDIVPEEHLNTNTHTTLNPQQQQQSLNTTSYTFNHTQLPSPTSSPLKSSNLSSPRKSLNIKTQNPNLSQLSLGSISSEKFIYDTKLRSSSSSPQKKSNSNENLGSNDNSINSNGGVKLVEFTRKGSLRDSAYDPSYTHHEESASIHHGSDSD